MKRILLSGLLLVAVGAFVFIATGASSKGNSAGTYKIELDNAFGLVSGADFKVAGVPGGHDRDDRPGPEDAATRW